MQNAETLLSIIRERGKRGLLLRRVYPLLYNPILIPPRLRPPVHQQGSDDARYDRRNRGRHEPAEDRAAH